MTGPEHCAEAEKLLAVEAVPLSSPALPLCWPLSGRRGQKKSPKNPNQQASPPGGSRDRPVSAVSARPRRR
jgi:hypothetical protein